MSALTIFMESAQLRYSNRTHSRNVLTPMYFTQPALINVFRFGKANIYFQSIVIKASSTKLSHKDA